MRRAVVLSEQKKSELRRRYVERLPAKISALVAGIEGLDDTDESAEPMVRRLAHQLRGSGGGFGWPEITEAAGEVEAAGAEELRARVTSLVELLQSIVASAGERDDRGIVLIVEDDADQLDLAQQTLAASGWRTHAVQTLADARSATETARYDAILLDLVLPDGDGRSLLSGLSRHGWTAQTPVVVMTARQSSRTHTECLALGCEHYLVKPVGADLLAATISRAVADARERVAEALRDSLTGAFNRAGLHDAFSRQQALRTRSRSPLALALLDLDRFKETNDTRGHDTGDAVLVRVASTLRSTLRDVDLVARWGGDEFVIIAPDSTAADLQRALDPCWQELDQLLPAAPAVKVSGGVVDVKMGESLQSAVQRADGALYSAKRAGGGRILLTATPLDDGICVLIAEDDQDTAALLQDALASASFRVRHASDGQEALREFSARTFDLVILDHRMPQLSGFDVLRELRAGNAGQSVPVLMLTAAGDENEIRRAFQFGADDYVVKPFQVHEVIARARRLLRKEIG